MENTEKPSDNTEAIMENTEKLTDNAEQPMENTEKPIDNKEPAGETEAVPEVSETSQEVPERKSSSATSTSSSVGFCSRCW